jgi:hypothetical protein
VIDQLRDSAGPADSPLCRSSARLPAGRATIPGGPRDHKCGDRTARFPAVGARSNDHWPICPESRAWEEPTRTCGSTSGPGRMFPDGRAKVVAWPTTRRPPPTRCSACSFRSGSLRSACASWPPWWSPSGDSRPAVRPG